MLRILLCLFLLFSTPVQAHALNHPLKVTATFSILGDFAKKVGGDQVQVYSLVGLDTSPYGYKPTPGDLLTIERCDLVVANGLGMEGWLAPLLQDSKETVRVLESAHGVQPRYGMGGGIDPHAWLNVAHAEIYIENIRDELVAVDPINAQYYKDNAEAYLYQLRKLDHWIKLQMGRLPAERRKIVTNYDSFAYFGAAYGVRVLPIQGLEPVETASASDFPEVLRRIKKENFSLLFSENTAGDRLLQEVSQLSGTKIAGKLYADALSTDPGVGNYIDLMKTNVQAIFDAIQPPAEKTNP